MNHKSAVLRLALPAVLLAGAVQISGLRARSEERSEKVASSTTRFSASLVDAGEKSRKREATVLVKVSGMTMMDPAETGEKAVPGQGHIRYRLDNGPVIATTSPKISFHELSAGPHTIEVELAGNDHSPLGFKQALTLEIP